eukprot:XP_001700824.1 predicted protein [Chlamydomonas reinhardtii]
MGGKTKVDEDRAKKATINTAQACQIVCPPDRHIPVEFNEIYMLVRTGMTTAERTRFEKIAQLVESLYAQEFMLLRRNLKHNFLRFSCGAKDQPLISAVGSGLPTVAELDNSEVKLIADFMQLMCAARFHIMTTAEWELAKADKFMFSLPVEVNWDYYDDRMLKSFWASTPERQELRARLPDMADRVLVFHRGITETGMYTNEKIDLLIDYLFTKPILKLWRRIRGIKPDLVGPRTLNLTESTHAARKVVERKTLRLHMPTAWAVIKNFHKKLKLQEPAFKEVVVLYRASVDHKKKAHKLPAIQRPVDQRQREILQRRNIHMKCFHDIPMADIDVIFADKKVYLKMLTIIQMVVTVVGGLVAAAAVLLKGDKVDMNVLWSSLSLVAARCGQVYTSAQAERSKTIQDCEKFLQKQFDLSIDFAVEDALTRLEEWHMVRRIQPKGAPRPKFEALNVEEAAHNLERQWEAAFEALSEPPDVNVFPLLNLVAESEHTSAPSARRKARIEAMRSNLKPSPSGQALPGASSLEQKKSGGGFLASLGLGGKKKEA